MRVWFDSQSYGCPFFVELQLKQQYIFVGTIEELVKTVALIGGLHGNFKERLEIIQSTHC